MALKEKLAVLFENNRGVYLSGEEIASKLNVSRGGVWKAVKTLQKEGYEISAVTNKGYCLSEKTDVISVTGIKKYLNNDGLEFNIEVLKSVDSTNNYLKESAGNGAAGCRAVISEEQTAGKGRFGRSFFSPNGTGVYLSILLRPNLTANDAVFITSLTAVAVAESIEAVTEKKADIKWVNDICINEKKVCGILTEASVSMENGGLDYLVVGIGINVFAPENSFPEIIKDKATSIFSENRKNIRNQLSALVLNNFMYHYRRFHGKEFVREYRKRSFVIGRQIIVNPENKSYEARVVDIDDNCRLIIETEDGVQKTLASGEISIKLK